MNIKIFKVLVCLFLTIASVAVVWINPNIVVDIIATVGGFFSFIGLMIYMDNL